MAIPKKMPRPTFAFILVQLLFLGVTEGNMNMNMNNFSILPTCPFHNHHFHINDFLAKASITIYFSHITASLGSSP